MFSQELKSDSGDLKTELMHMLEAYTEFHRVLAFLLQSQHLLNMEPMEMTESIADGQWYFIRAVRVRSEQIRTRLEELYQMERED